MDLFDPVSMVRGAAFGANFTPKLVVSVIAICLVVWDVRERRRWDYVWVFLTGTAVWTLVEVALQLRGTRVMPEHLLFGVQLPLPLSALLQGMAEGAFVAVLGLFIGDRVLARPTRARALVGFGLALFIVVLLAVLEAARDPLHAHLASSRRDMVTVASLLVFLLVVTFDVWFWVARPRFRRRSMAMAAVMLLFAAVWTCSAVATGSRWVEVNGATGAPVTAPPAVTIAALAYDVIVEIVLAYVPFFAIPALLGLIPASPRTSLAPGREEVPA